MKKHKMTLLRAALAFGICLVISGSVYIEPVRASTLTVTTFVDSYDGTCGTTHCSLREAIIEANMLADNSTIQLSAGTYTLTRDGLDATGELGDLDIRENMFIVGAGPGLTIIDAQNIHDRVFDVRNEAVVRISDLSIINGSTINDGGGVSCEYCTLTLNNVIINNNESLNIGGGIYSLYSNLTLNSTTISENTASHSGGGMYLDNSEVGIFSSLISDNSSADDNGGGGVVCYETRLTIEESSLTNNMAGVGGAIYASGGTSMLILERSTIANNFAELSGGGIAFSGGRSITMKNSTISGNTAKIYAGGMECRTVCEISNSSIVFNIANADSDDTGNGGGLFCYKDSSSSCEAKIYNTIIANNIDRSTINPRHDCSNYAGTLSSLGYNLVEFPGNCTFSAVGDITGQDPRIGTLRDNGGPTLTHALLFDSPAIDAGDNGYCPETDQRGTGFPRPLDGDEDGTATCDIGAYETVPLRGLFLPLILR